MNNIDEFLDFEKRYKLFELEVGGEKVWPIIREKVFYDISRLKQGIGIAHTTLNERKYYEKVHRILKFIPNVIFNKVFPLKKKEVLIFNHSRRVKNGEYYDCLYTDSFLEKMDHSYYVFEDSFLEEHLKPIRTKNLKYTDRINYKFYFEFYARKFFGGLNLTNLEKSALEGLVKNINRIFNLSIDSNDYLEQIKVGLLKYKLLYRYYEKVIDSINPKIIFEVVSYERRRKVINDIAKKKGIPTVELQHGTMGKYHVAYNFLEKMELSTFPDYVFLFGQFWKDNTRLPISDSKVRVIGWPYYEEKVASNKISKRNDNKKVILFISQGTIGKDLSKVAVEISEMIGKDEYRIIYKLHPGEYARWKNKYPWLIGTDIVVIDNNEHDMHYFFAQADIQVGVYSTAIFEGLGYGLKTFIVKLFGHEYMEELYKNDYASLIESSDEFLNKLEMDNGINRKYDIAYFWENNSIENIIREINSIINTEC